MSIVAITGLAAEARIARRAGWQAVAGGGDAARTLELIDLALRDGAEALVSFGIAGGLLPEIPSGALLLPEAVVEADGTRYEVDAAWRSKLGALLGPGIEGGDILGTQAIAATASEKAALHLGSGAVAVDLESHLVARSASAAGVPWFVLRAVADPAMRDLPPAALLPLDAAGRARMPAILRSVGLKPGQIPALIRLARESRAALVALAAAVRKIS